MYFSRLIWMLFLCLLCVSPICGNSVYYESSDIFNMHFHCTVLLLSSQIDWKRAIVSEISLYWCWLVTHMTELVIQLIKQLCTKFSLYYPWTLSKTPVRFQILQKNVRWNNKQDLQIKILYKLNSSTNRNTHFHQGSKHILTCIKKIHNIKEMPNDQF